MSENNYFDQEFDGLFERKRETYQKQSSSLVAIEELEQKIDHELAAMDEKIKKLKEMIE